MHGFHGRLLHIDLNSGKHHRRDLEESRLRAFLGGIGHLVSNRFLPKIP
jgi:aldehyde:ferredoxin oxidoreductase